MMIVTAKHFISSPQITFIVILQHIKLKDKTTSALLYVTHLIFSYSSSKIKSSLNRYTHFYRITPQQINTMRQNV